MSRRTARFSFPRDVDKNGRTIRDGGDMAVRAPYAFVSLFDGVISTPWGADGPRHDKPHPEGLCGTIDVTWAPESPILVSSSQKKGNAAAFCEVMGPKGRVLALPGSSLRGLVRSTLEALTSARMITDRMAHYATRDMDHQKWKDSAPTPNNLKRIQISAGFLRPASGRWQYKEGETEGWEYVPCSATPLMTSDLIDFRRQQNRKLEVDRGDSPPQVLQRFEELPSIAEKYAQLGGPADWAIRFVGEDRVDSRGNKTTYAKPTAAATGPLGLVVMSGPDPQAGDPRKSKKRSYVFHSIKAEAVKVPSAMMMRFLSTNARVSDGTDDAKPRSMWGFWEQWFRDGRSEGDGNNAAHSHIRGIPVFLVHPTGTAPASALDGKSPPALAYLAMSKLVKVPFARSVAEILDAQRQDKTPGTLDFVQALFGHVPPEERPSGETAATGYAWRGRLTFHDALLTGPASSNRIERHGQTMSPKPSFWPFYLVPAPTRGKADTPYDYDNPASALAGWKRYPPRNLSRTGQEARFPGQDEPEAGATVSRMRFLPPGGEFRGTIRFHNLLPVELGALLWALTLGKPGNERRHMIGRGRAQGFGQTRAMIARLSAERNRDGTNLSDPGALIAEFEQQYVSLWQSANPTRAAGVKGFDDIAVVRELKASSTPRIGAALAKAGMLDYPAVQVTVGGRPLPKDKASPSIEGYKLLRSHATQLRGRVLPAYEDDGDP
jgi:hypothetical protein